MSYVRIQCKNNQGAESTICLAHEPVKCPCCQSLMQPDVLYAYSSRHGVFVFARCTNHSCEKTFISQYRSTGELLASGFKPYAFSFIVREAGVENKTFSEIISNISPSFVRIYNQAYTAQQLSLSDICGVGYRKAIEFLIKDYIISKLSDEAAKEKIKRKQLMQCIEQDIDDAKIKAVAARATWLGNDETHYVRKWEEKDVHALCTLIDLTIHWIESEIESERLLKEMPEPRK